MLTWTPNTVFRHNYSCQRPQKKRKEAEEDVFVYFFVLRVILLISNSDTNCYTCIYVHSVGKVGKDQIKVSEEQMRKLQKGVQLAMKMG